MHTVTAIVRRALLETVTDLGQLTADEHADLKYAIRRGWITKSKGGPFPILKTVYARVGFDFAGDRARHQNELHAAHMHDVQRGIAKFFPWVDFQSR